METTSFTISFKRFNTVGILCSSYPGRDKIFAEAAIKIGELLAKKKIQVIYGGGKMGLMGAVATTACVGGSPVVGVMPKFLAQGCESTVGSLIQVCNTTERTSMMYQSANVFIMLPGGQDTLEEFACILSWSSMASHIKPIFVLNINGYFNNLLAFLDNAVRNGFMYSSTRIMVISAVTVEELIRKLLIYRNYSDPEILQMPSLGKRKRELDHKDLNLSLSL